MLISLLLFIQPLLAQVDSAAQLKRDEINKQLQNYMRFKLDKTPVEEKTLNEYEILRSNKTFGEQMKGLSVQQEQLLEAQLKQAQALGIIVSPAEAIIPGPGEGPDSSLSRNKKRLSGPSAFDSRIELRQLNPLVDWQQRILMNAASVGLVIRKENLEAVTDSFYRINTSLTLGEKYKLCPGQSFTGQPVAGEGTAFIIGARDSVPLMMTAGHVFSDPLSHYAIIFGYEMENSVNAYELLIPVTNVYYPEQIVWKDTQGDMVVVMLNKPAERQVLKLSAREPSLKQAVYMIGYPCGLPEKVSLNADIHNTSHPEYFYTSLDAFQGNSGSPVFSMDTHEVIGILVSGEVDFSWNGSCSQVTLCRIPYCKGEKVMRIVNSIP